MRAPALMIACSSLALAFAGPVSAQPAPITYAGQNAPPPSQALAPSSEESASGYSDMRDRVGPPQNQPPAAPYEVEAPRPAPVTQAAGEAAPGPGRPAWLEQERVGPPYQANGRWFVPTPEPGYEMTGIASWYGPQFHAQATSSGEPFDMDGISAAHPTLPIPSLVQVTNLENGREIIVRVNDRGPYVADRVIDLSRGAARVLGFEQTGTARVHVRYLGPAPRLVAAGDQPAPIASVQSPPMGPAVLTPPVALASAPQQAAAADGAFVVQVGAYSDLANAQRVRAAVADVGPANVDERQGARGTLYRVRVGPFANAADAEAARARAAQLGYGESVVAVR